MSRSRKPLLKQKRSAPNKQRRRGGVIGQVKAMNRRAAGLANRYCESSSLRHIRASLASDTYDEYQMSTWERLIRWMIALVAIPLCYITTCTLFDVLSQATQSRGFWYSPEFWFFATGMLLMSGWFFTKLGQRKFLHLYVLGHEFTHAIFAMLHLGRIIDLKANADGGYVATNKHNVIISLSPYFFPFWSVMCIGIYGILALFIDLPEYSDHILYAVTGATWTFHILWTLWMIPRDQPDLRDNDTFFSLVTIYLANVLLLSVLLCVAVDAMSFEAYGAAWSIEAEQFYRWANRWVGQAIE